MSLGEVVRVFRRYPSPWLLCVALLGALAGRILVGDWRSSDIVLPLMMLAVFPVVEWVIHVCVLHWRFFKLERAMILLPLLLPGVFGCNGNVLGGADSERCGSRSRIA